MKKLSKKQFLATLSAAIVCGLTACNNNVGSSSNNDVTPTPTPTSTPASGRFAYFANRGGDSYTQCTVSSSDGTLSGCTTVVPSAPGDLNVPSGLTINNGYAYFANRGGNSYTQCTVSSSDGTLSGCTTVVPAAPGALNAPGGLTINNGYAYFANSGDNGDSYTQCTVSSSDGTLSGCNTVVPGAPGALNHPGAIVISNGYAYIANSGVNSYTQCAVSSSDGTLSGCTTVAPAAPGAILAPGSIAISNGYAYITNSAVNSNSYTQCTVSSSDGTLSGCTTVVPAAPGDLSNPKGIGINNGYAYITNSAVNSNSYTQCTVSSSDGTLSACTTVVPAAPGALNRPFGIAFN